MSKFKFIKTAETVQTWKMIDELLVSLKRVVEPDIDLFKTVIKETGLPRDTQEMKYLQYNQQAVSQTDRTVLLSLVAMINNQTADRFQLRGVRKRLSQKLFSLSKNLMDVFVNKIRCDEIIMGLMAGAKDGFSFVGMLQIDEIDRSKFLKKKLRRIRPVVLIPGVDSDQLKLIKTFESQNEVRKQKRFGLPLYKKM